MERPDYRKLYKESQKSAVAFLLLASVFAMLLELICMISRFIFGVYFFGLFLGASLIVIFSISNEISRLDREDRIRHIVRKYGRKKDA